MKSNAFPIVLATLGMVFAGCSSIETQHNDWTTYDGPGGEYFLREEVSLTSPADPGESINRKIWAFNKGAFNYVGRPLAKGWRWVVPQPVQGGLTNFANNLAYPIRLVNNLLQGKGQGAWDETARFAQNTTLGVLGFYDYVGDSRPRSEEDFGQTFERANWREPSFVVLPLLGPSTTRDSLGLVFDTAFNPLTYFFPASPVSSFNDLNAPIIDYKIKEESNYDLYNLAQFVATLNRQVEIEDYVHIEETCEYCAATETIQAIFQGVRDADFPDLRDDRKVYLSARHRELGYTLFLQPEPAPLVYILPGLGGHRLGNTALGLAEMAYSRGFSTVTISSSMNFEFIENASSVDLPGFAPVDSHDVHLALDAIQHDLKKAYPGRIKRKALMGISLGAFHTLFIAAAEADPDNSLISFDRYLAINPPVRLEYGLKKLDSYFNAPLDNPPPLRQGMILHTLRKALEIGQGSLTPTTELPFSEQESQFLIGLAFRNTLKDIIFQTQLRSNMGVLKTELSSSQRLPAYAEISEFSYLEYFYAFLLPYFSEQLDDVSYDEEGAQRLFDLTDLRSIEDALKANHRVRLMTNEDDFLLAADDLEWLSSVVGMEYCLHFEHGGHLGNLYLDEVQDTAMSALIDLLDLEFLPFLGE